LTEEVLAGAATAPGGTTRATLVGAVAIVLWSALALLATGVGEVPPFQLVAMSFAVAAALAAAKWLLRGESILGHLRQPPTAWLVGTGGLFLYHFLYFLALRQAPAVEVSLICYLWPLLIVIFAALLPGETLRWWHVAGALLGLLGTALLITEGGKVAFHAEYALGYGAAFGCAITWAGYSTLSRRFARVPTDAVGGFCAATSVLALICHLAWETTRWPHGAEWLAVIALGLGPVGLAFFVWDYGVKRGSLKTLGGLSYTTPLLSTILLIAFGRAAASATIAAAALLIVGGAVLAARDMWSRQR
jgi:drug/metabolite transporter (DMT)-like permease